MRSACSCKHPKRQSSSHRLMKGGERSVNGSGSKRVASSDIFGFESSMTNSVAPEALSIALTWSKYVPINSVSSSSSFARSADKTSSKLDFLVGYPALSLCALCCVPGPIPDLTLASLPSPKLRAVILPFVVAVMVVLAAPSSHCCLQRMR